MLSKRTPPSRSRLAAVSQPSRRHLAAVSQPSRRRVPRRCLAGASPVPRRSCWRPIRHCFRSFFVSHYSSLLRPFSKLLWLRRTCGPDLVGLAGCGPVWDGVSVSPTSMKMPPAHHARPCGKVLKGNHATLMDVGHASDGLMPRCATDPEDIVSGPSFLASHCDSSVCSR